MEGEIRKLERIAYRFIAFSFLVRALILALLRPQNFKKRKSYLTTFS